MTGLEITWQHLWFSIWRPKHQWWHNVWEACIRMPRGISGLRSCQQLCIMLVSMQKGNLPLGCTRLNSDRIPVGHGPYITQRDFRATQYLTNSDMVSSSYTSIKSLCDILSIWFFVAMKSEAVGKMGTIADSFQHFLWSSQGIWWNNTGFHLAKHWPNSSFMMSLQCADENSR